MLYVSVFNSNTFHDCFTKCCMTRTCWCSRNVGFITTWRISPPYHHSASCCFIQHSSKQKIMITRQENPDVSPFLCLTMCKRKWPWRKEYIHTTGSELIVTMQVVHMECFLSPCVWTSLFFSRSHFCQGVSDFVYLFLLGKFINWAGLTYSELFNKSTLPCLKSSLHSSLVGLQLAAGKITIGLPWARLLLAVSCHFSGSLAHLGVGHWLSSELAHPCVQMR